MNLDKLFTWIIGTVIAFAACGQLETLQRWVWRAQAKVVYESRTSTWGSPRFFSPQSQVRRKGGKKLAHLFPQTKSQKQKVLYENEKQ